MDYESKEKPKLNLRSTKNDPNIALRQIDLYPRLGDVSAKTIFNVVEAMSVNIFIETDFSDNYVESTYSTKRRPKALSKTDWYPFNKSLG